MEFKMGSKRGGVVMNTFQIVKLNNEPYDFLVIATSCKNPLSSFYEIGTHLGKQTAKLIFDLTLINGTKSNRYIKCNYESDKAMFQRCEIAKEVDNNIKLISQKYFFENEDIVKHSVIPNSLKFLLLNELV